MLLLKLTPFMSVPFNPTTVALLPSKSHPATIRIRILTHSNSDLVCASNDPRHLVLVILWDRVLLLPWEWPACSSGRSKGTRVIPALDGLQYLRRSDFWNGHRITSQTRFGTGTQLKLPGCRSTMQVRLNWSLRENSSEPW